MSCDNLLQFVPFMSCINPTFWHKYTEVKIDTDRLSDEAKKIFGFYTNVLSSKSKAWLEIDSTSLNSCTNIPNDYFPSHGIFINKNTAEQFKMCDKQSLLNEQGSELWKDIHSGKILDDPTLLNKFLVLAFCEFKCYKYYFNFAFPSAASITYNHDGQPKLITNEFNEAKIENILQTYQHADNKLKSFFVLKVNDSSDCVDFMPLKAAISLDERKLLFDDLENVYFTFSDPSKTEEVPGWPLRNFLLGILHYCRNLQGKTINVISFRISRQIQVLHCKNSLVFRVKLPVLDVEALMTEGSKWVGWELNDSKKFAPKVANMASSLDPEKLAATSAELNLKLMRWRLVPDLDLDKLKHTKCLLFGAGALGCAVARVLLGWGMHNITFVDNGKVSYSNPVRQYLYTSQQCKDGGTPKVDAAVHSLKSIFSGINACGHQLSIPMPDHPVGESCMQETEKAVEKIEELISEHDIIFLLTDSRESRWLPTLLGAFYGKIVLTAALGFDSYLVMRHGFHSSKEESRTYPELPKGIEMVPGDELGCYFCNDVTAPGDSFKDRTLDQQCTVTRPGGAAIAGALIVELAVSILQHNKEAFAGALCKTVAENVNLDDFDPSLLGTVPHSIRGFLSTYTQILPTTKKYSQCVACSDHVLEAYKTDGKKFLIDVFNSSKCLEDITGLTDLLKEIDNVELLEEYSDEDDDEDAIIP